MSKLRIDHAAREDLREAAHVLSIAIAPTRNSIALWGGMGERLRVRIEKTMYLAHLHNPHYRTLIARLDGRIVGVHSMLPWPHCQPGVLEAIRLARWMLPITRWASFKGMVMQAVSSRLDPPEEHWHLGPIGVLPDQRGHGIGKELVEYALAEFDREGSAAYLETDQIGVVKQEEQLGFRVIGEARILGVHNWLMWRNPVDMQSQPNGVH